MFEAVFAFFIFTTQFQFQLDLKAIGQRSRSELTECYPMGTVTGETLETPVLHRFTGNVVVRFGTLAAQMKN